MLEYGEAYYEGNRQILAQMKASMSPEAYALAEFMAEEILWEEDEEDLGFERNVDFSEPELIQSGAEILTFRCRQDD